MTKLTAWKAVTPSQGADSLGMSGEAQLSGTGTTSTRSPIWAGRESGPIRTPCMWRQNERLSRILE